MSTFRFFYDRTFRCFCFPLKKTSFRFVFVWNTKKLQTFLSISISKKNVPKLLPNFFFVFQKSNLKRNVLLIKKKIRRIERIVYYRIVNILWSFVQIIVVKKCWSYFCLRFVQILIFFLKLAYVLFLSTSFYEQLLLFRLDLHLFKTFTFVSFRSSWCKEKYLRFVLIFNMQYCVHPCRMRMSGGGVRSQFVFVNTTPPASRTTVQTCTVLFQNFPAGDNT